MSERLVKRLFWGALFVISAIVALEALPALGKNPGFPGGQGQITRLADRTASDYDGTNDYQLRGADWTGAADGKKFIVSFWFLLDGGDGGNQQIVNDSNGRFRVRRHTDNIIRVIGANTSGTTILSIDTSNTYTADSTWHHFIMTGDMAVAGSGNIFVDGVQDYSETTFTDDTIDFTQADHSLGAQVDGGNKINMRIANVYINIAENITLNSETVRKFRTADGKPVFLGDQCEFPTGNQPIACSYEGDLTTNLGSGGTYSTTGSLDSVQGPIQ